MKCPGQDMQYWKPGAIFEVECPQCGRTVEFFKDDTARKCAGCGHRFVNPRMDFGCAAYCPYAEQCLGTLPDGLAAKKEELLKDRVAVAMKQHFKNDFTRIGRAGRVARYAERIGKRLSGNLAVILSAAYLLEANGADAGDAPPAAREILARLGAREELIAEVMEIIGRRHHAEPVESINAKAVLDADLLEELDLKQKTAPLPAEELAAVIAERFRTEAGRELARETLLTAR